MTFQSCLFAVLQKDSVHAAHRKAEDLELDIPKQVATKHGGGFLSSAPIL